ncbi:hypothetical protein R2B67_00175 [Streptomyces cyaneofuscatus]|uniref:hypothetical protein n=1 Tax=Streptomyces cyaneofuscatus TaxID=66883 RepID=UPI0029540C54|nr:hypothetical protein [Streptomyces cyaneofuscatus]WOP07046.1 hypothetical protein R2B67_00175 [Streptomyces cyaneofuscatus]
MPASWATPIARTSPASDRLPYGRLFQGGTAAISRCRWLSARRFSRSARSRGAVLARVAGLGLDCGLGDRLGGVVGLSGELLRLPVRLSGEAGGYGSRRMGPP